MPFLFIIRLISRISRVSRSSLIFDLNLSDRGGKDAHRCRMKRLRRVTGTVYVMRLPKTVTEVPLYNLRISLANRVVLVSLLRWIASSQSDRLLLGTSSLLIDVEMFASLEYGDLIAHLNCRCFCYSRDHLHSQAGIVGVCLGRFFAPASKSYSALIHASFRYPGRH